MSRDRLGSCINSARENSMKAVNFKQKIMFFENNIIINIDMWDNSYIVFKKCNYRIIIESKSF